MNYGTAVILLLALLIFALTVAALMFYVRHWAARQTQQAPTAQVTEGRFIKRYIPPPLRPHYDRERAMQTRRPFIRRPLVARLLNFAIGVLALAVVSGALGVNYYKLLTPIDLTPEEVQALQMEESSWVTLPETGLPSMERRVARLRSRGVALVASRADEERAINGQRINAMAARHWQQFFVRWNIPYRLCDWHELSACMEGRIGIVLPGSWQLKEMEWALYDGASLLLYGPPATVLAEQRPLQWRGLTFAPFANGSEPRYIVLRGDQLLTLGFDAGLILQADNAIKGYRVFSDSPQAIGISTDRTMGGVVDTRVYAKGVGKGRLVWMDYAPDQFSQPESINERHLQALNAAVFRYLLGESYAGWATWPEGKVFAGLISEDSEDKFHYAERIVKMVRANAFPITWFILSNEAQQHRSLTQRMAEVGEVACHGDSHVAFPMGGLPKQTERLARCTKALQTITGHTPRGFRPPEERYNGDTINAVASIGMSYYMAESTMDRMVPVVMRENGGTRELVSLPRMGADDYEMWHTLKLNGEESLRLADDQLAWVSVVGGFLPFSFHTQYMDKQENVAVVEHYGRRFQQPDCYFSTAGQIADWWRARTGLVSGEVVTKAVLAKYRPVRLRVNAQGQLTREPAETVTASTEGDEAERLSTRQASVHADGQGEMATQATAAD